MNRLHLSLLALAALTLLSACSTVPSPPVPAPPAAAAHAAADGPVAPAVPVRVDERRSEQPFTVNLLDRPTQLRLGYELTLERRNNFDLNAARDRNRRVRDQELKVEARMRASDRVTLLAEAVWLSELRRTPATGAVTRNRGTQRGQLWALVERIGGTPLSLQVGRLALVDRRAWWWDEDLDAVRLAAAGPDWRVETGYGRELARKTSFDPGIALPDRGVGRWFGQASWRWQPRHTLEAFWLHAKDRSGTPAPGTLWRPDDADTTDARLLWLGLRASGNVRMAGGHRWNYWVDTAGLRGRQMLTTFGDETAVGVRAGASTRQSVRGLAFDLGTQWTLDLPLKPTATLALARGSGSADGGPVNRNFQQTGLHENKVRLGGVKRLQRYGELLDPELSNLQVGTVGLGLRLLDNTSFEMVWHHYRQTVPSALLSGSRLSQAPEGLNPDIGHEIDLYLAWREWRHAELTLALSRFIPGAAFAADRRDPAHSVELGLALNF